MRGRAAGLTGLAALWLGGCIVGPDYTRPSGPLRPTYKETEGWKAAQPSDHLPRGQWSSPRPRQSRHLVVVFLITINSSPSRTADSSPCRSA